VNWLPCDIIHKHWQGETGKVRKETKNVGVVIVKMSNVLKSMDKIKLTATIAFRYVNIS